MGKRGSKPKEKVKIEWSANFAYAIGLIVTDGCLYNDSRHITFVSKDIEQIENYMKCLAIETTVGQVVSGHAQTIAYRVQFGDVLFHTFLRKIGIHPAKSKTIGAVNIPLQYFFDYVRGCFDGDGSFYSYWDPRWKSSHMFYVQFVSASKEHIDWLQKTLKDSVGVHGYVSTSEKSSVVQLRYAKKEGLEIIQKMYYSPDVVCLKRKRDKIRKALAIEQIQ